MEYIRKILKRIDGRGYKAYKELEGEKYHSGNVEIRIAKIQGDPFATPSIIEAKTGISDILRPVDEGWSRALSDLASRILHRVTRRYTRKCGTASSCEISTPRPGPWILVRSQAEVVDKNLLLRVYAGLPADGRRVKGREAERLLLEALPRVFGEVSEWFESHTDEALRHVHISLDQDALRSWLYDNGYVAFIRDGAILPRESSLSQRPLENAIRFESPSELRVSVDLPYAGTVHGLALGGGVNVVTGGGFHGKTTLIEAIQDGIYNHVEGDGREYVVALRETFLVRAEDGRIVTSVDISPMIERLPWGRDTRGFSTLDASGSTSMAASIVEAIQLGAKLLLIDEDTSATNLLYKDAFMSKLIPDDPLIPLTLTARSLARRLGVSLIIVAGASSAFIPLSDQIVLMRKYKPYIPDVNGNNGLPASPPEKPFRKPADRVITRVPEYDKVKVIVGKAVFKSRGRIQEIDLRLNPRFVEAGQARMAVGMLKYLARKRRKGLAYDLVGELENIWMKDRFRGFFRVISPDLTFVYPEDALWMANRLLGLEAEVLLPSIL
ncbi:MAG: ABC-ATPase domain-containing protein [Desulfurococcales archaeon]|nr:ABC-ATPase domain-containing protein [Desulfurococcales archaeon]